MTFHAESSWVRGGTGPMSTSPEGYLDRACPSPSAEGEIVWRERLAEVDVPMLFVAGRADHVVTPDRVKAFQDAVVSPDLDFGCAPAAEDALFPPLIAWLADRP